MTRKYLQIPERFLPYKGVAYFFILLVVTHYFWKLTMDGDESDNYVTFFGIDLTMLFNYSSDHVARVAISVLHFFRSDAVLLANNVIQHPNGESVRIIWACTGLKQAYIFFFIIAFNHGSLKNKLWYIPLGLIVVYLYNIIRICIITAIIEYHASMFNFIHGYLLKYLFYAIIFGLWVLWEEKISGNSKKLETKNEYKNF